MQTTFPANRINLSETNLSQPMKSASSQASEGGDYISGNMEPLLWCLKDANFLSDKYATFGTHLLKMSRLSTGASEKGEHPNALRLS